MTNTNQFESLIKIAFDEFLDNRVLSLQQKGYILGTSIFLAILTNSFARCKEEVQIKFP